MVGTGLSSILAVPGPARKTLGFFIAVVGISVFMFFERGAVER
jgi:hypothetical protein